MGLQGKYKPSVPGTITGNVREYHSARFLGSDIFRQTEVFIGETGRAELSNPSHIPEAQILSWKLPESIHICYCCLHSTFSDAENKWCDSLHSAFFYCHDHYYCHECNHIWRLRCIFVPLSPNHWADWRPSLSLVQPQGSYFKKMFFLLIVTKSLLTASFLTVAVLSVLS